MAEIHSNKKHLGRTLKCVKRAMNCYSMVGVLGGDEPSVGGDCQPLLSFALGVAGDCYMGCVYDWDSVPVYHKQYNCGLTAEAGIAREIEKYTTELDRDWTSGRAGHQVLQEGTALDMIGNRCDL